MTEKLSGFEDRPGDNEGDVRIEIALRPTVPTDFLPSVQTLQRWRTSSDLTAL